MDLIIEGKGFEYQPQVTKGQAVGKFYCPLSRAKPFVVALCLLSTAKLSVITDGLGLDKRKIH